MKTIFFSGITWFIKNGNNMGPGPNNWSDNNVYVDSAGNLHLKVNKIKNKWYCAEIFSKDVAPCGEYTFYLATNVNKLDKNIVAGLFMYENDRQEIDIEFNNNIASYSVQPNETHEFQLNLQGDYSTHGILFYPSFIEFYSIHGHRTMPMLYPTAPFHLPQPDIKSGLIIEKWQSESGNSANLPKAHLHINFWLKNGKPPKEAGEIIIKGIEIRYAEYVRKLS